MDSKIIIHSLLNNTEFTGKVLPYLKEEYFPDTVDKTFLKIINAYATAYNAIPTIDVLKSAIKEIRGLTQVDYERSQDLIIELQSEYKAPSMQWLLEETEKFCQHQSVFNAVSQAVAILNDDSQTPTSAIPDILKEALAVSFNSSVGHDYELNVTERYDLLHEQTARLKFDIDAFNTVFAGGAPRKTLNCFMGGAGSGKSLVLSHVAAGYYKQGLNVVYVTLELAEERIGERFDANLFGVDVIDIPNISLIEYKENVERIAKKTKGAKLFIKEFPPATITPGHIRTLLNELKLKKDFKCDVLIVDYLNLLTSARVKQSNGTNSYSIIKSICEELRAVAIEEEIAIFTATQTNRGGLNSSDVDMTNISESIGLAATVDSLLAIVRTDELDEMQQVMFKVLKTRFSDKTNWRFLTGINLNQMKLINLSGAASSAIRQESSRLESIANEQKPAFTKNRGNKPGNDIQV